MKRLLSVTVIAVMVGMPAAAFAHAAYKDSSPRDEETIASAPGSVWAEYTEPLQDGSHLEIYDPCGTRVDHDDTEITGYRMEVSMTGERSGVYSVRWVAASAIDPHVTRGTFTFTVTDGPACEGSSATEEESEATEERASQETSTSVTKGGTERDPARRSGDVGERGTKVKGRLVTAQGNDSRRRPRGRRLVAQESPRGTAPEERGLWDDMPWDWFAIAMALAALIGAAGGRIYAGIMGPRR